MPGLGPCGGPGHALFLHQLSDCACRQPLALGGPGQVVDAFLDGARDRGGTAHVLAGRRANRRHTFPRPARDDAAFPLRDGSTNVGNEPTTVRAGIYAEVQADHRPGPALRPVKDVRKVTSAAGQPVEGSYGERVGATVVKVGQGSGEHRPTVQGLGARRVLLAEGEIPPEDFGGVAETPRLGLRRHGLLVGRAADVAQHSQSLVGHSRLLSRVRVPLPAKPYLEHLFNLASSCRRRV